MDEPPLMKGAIYTHPTKGSVVVEDAYSVYFDLRDRGDVDARRWLNLAQSLSDQLFLQRL